MPKGREQQEGAALELGVPMKQLRAAGEVGIPAEPQQHHGPAAEPCQHSSSLAISQIRQP